MDKIIIFDTTLRDGEQTPHVNFSLEDKVRIAKQLERLGVDVIEGGFAAASQKSSEALKAISKEIKKSTVCSLARALKSDIDAAYDAIKEAKHKRIHTFIATSPVHMKFKLKMSEDEVVEKAIKAVKYAKTLVDDVEFSAEDASRSNPDFLVRIFTEVIKAGASTINIPDTVGYVMPEEFYEMIAYIKTKTPGIDNVTISVHCHNDLGLATANSLASIRAGARQVECTINGIGERAGNTALEELVMGIKTRKDLYSDYYSTITTPEIMKSSTLVSYLGGINVQPNKAIVGENAFSHESGIHQHGVLENPETYEIIDPQSVGIHKNKIVLGNLSGRHAFSQRLADLGFSFDDEKTNELFKSFKALADTKKEIHDEDLLMLVNGIEDKEKFVGKVHLVHYNTFKTSDDTVGEITLNVNGLDVCEKSSGVGPVDALFRAISKIFEEGMILDKYQLDAITGDTEALARVSVTLKSQNEVFTGRSHSTDIIEASIYAYLNAMLGGVNLESGTV